MFKKNWKLIAGLGVLFLFLIGSHVCGGQKILTLTPPEPQYDTEGNLIPVDGYNIYLSFQENFDIGLGEYFTMIDIGLNTTLAVILCNKDVWAKARCYNAAGESPDSNEATTHIGPCLPDHPPIIQWPPA